MNLTQKQKQHFRETILSYYENYGRKDLPWRNTSNPYYILVSEIMLQQTQVKRVIQKYTDFITQFPDITALANAPLNDVLSMWSGLGYNRRGLYLKKTAEKIIAEYNSTLPDDYQTLKSLPGIGPATASEIMAFAFNTPIAFIETNIRAVYIHFFFSSKEDVADKEIMPCIQQTIDTENPRRWYYALMDYGVMLKTHYSNPSRKSAHYTKQSKFEGSNRQARGLIIKTLTSTPHNIEELAQTLKISKNKIQYNVSKLVEEGMVAEEAGKYKISE